MRKKKNEDKYDDALFFIISFVLLLFIFFWQSVRSHLFGFCFVFGVFSVNTTSPLLFTSKTATVCSIHTHVSRVGTRNPTHIACPITPVPLYYPTFFFVRVILTKVPILRFITLVSKSLLKTIIFFLKILKQSFC